LGGASERKFRSSASKNLNRSFNAKVPKQLVRRSSGGEFGNECQA
jgi:hypothetical protein